MSKKHHISGDLKVDGTIALSASATGTANDNWVKQYEIAVSDEHYYRDQFHSRLRYHTTILTGIAGGLGVGYFNAKSASDFLIIAVFSGLFTWLCFDSADALKRIYNHFIEMLRVREELECVLGLRRLDTLEHKTSIWGTLEEGGAGYWPKDQAIYTKAWVGTRHKDGYYARTRRAMIVFGVMGYGSLAVALVAAGVLLYERTGVQP